MSIVPILVGIICGGCVVGLYMDFRHKIIDLAGRVAKLEQSTPKRLPYRTADEIEDAEAALIKFMREIDFDKSVIENALGHLQNARNPERKNLDK